jgi:hypothetical protein
MKKIYRSKLNLWIFLPVFLALFAIEVFFIYKGMLFGMIAVALITAIAIYLCVDNVYILTNDNKLRIKSSFLFEKEIYIKSIKKIRPTKDHHTSPALSYDRIEILYNRYGRIVVSPQHKLEFISRLKEVNPRIITE